MYLNQTLAQGKSKSKNKVTYSIFIKNILLIQHIAAN